MKKKKAARGNKVAVTFEMAADIQAETLSVAGTLTTGTRRQTP